MLKAKLLRTSLAATAVGLLALTATPLGPRPLSASTPTTAVRTALCSYLARAIAYLEAQRPSPLRDFLMAEARKLYTSRCG